MNNLAKAFFNAAVFSFSVNALCFDKAANAQDANAGVYIIYDSSNSMWAALPDKSRKYEAARTAMRELAGRDFGNRDVALRMYGHRRKDDCTDSQLIVPFSKSTDVADQMIAAMQQARPTGRTPIDLSLRQALDDFGTRSGSIILISDGVESCDADPCALVKAWREKDIDITVHVVGLGLKGKEKAAMQCIADAAGTRYRDAFSADELIDSLGEALDQARAGEKPQPGTPTPEPDETGPEFALIVETPDGARQRGKGVLTNAAGTTLEVETFQRYTPQPGTYTLTAGVEVIGGGAYQPVTARVVVTDNNRTNGRIVAPTPPQVSASFAMEGEDLRATVVTVYRDGEKIGSFKGDETAFVAEGTYEFRSKLRGTSQPLRVTETFAAGDAKTIRFDAAIEVHLTVHALGSANGVQFKGRPATELWQNGTRIHKINSSSGGLVTPGAYTLHINDRINVVEMPIEVTREPKQVLEVEVPAGGLIVQYRDAAGADLPSERVFITPEQKRRGQVRPSSKSLALVPGKYRITGWPKRNGYPDVEIDVQAGVNQTVILQATK